MAMRREGGVGACGAVRRQLNMAVNAMAATAEAVKAQAVKAKAVI